LGILGVSRLSTVYYDHSRREILLSVKLVALACLAGAALVAVCWLVRRSRLVVAGPPRAWAARLGAAAVPAFFALLLARPLWLTNYETPDPRWGCAALVPIVQAQTGLPVQPCRLYDEFAAHWLARYFTS